MFRKQHKKITTFLSFLTAIQMVFFSVLPAEAGLFGGGGGISLPSPSQVAGELERRYNINLGSIQNQSQYFNVSDSKKITPEVSLFFTPSDPKEGQKITARAFPIYFSNPEESLYYTWYLRRKGCDLDDSPSQEERDLCDRDDNRRIDANDWKIEAMRVIAQGGFEATSETYGVSDNDGDGYNARFGGDNRADVPNYCYVHDPRTGTNYELASVSSGVGFACPAGKTPVCMDTTETVNPSTSTLVNGDGSVSTFSVASGSSTVIGTPLCNNTTVSCTRGTACCVSDPSTATSCESALTSCVAAEVSGNNQNVTNLCKHLFPRVAGHPTGDGSFSRDEEEFWGTDPRDPSTADNGKKDEANAVGLGVSEFTWNYIPGDKVGVAVEGTSMLSTKHDDSSMMVMWAFPKNQCYPNMNKNVTGNQSSYVRNIKGYSVTIPTTDLDMNQCIVSNLIDPTEGGQATKMEVEVSVTPDAPMNDESEDQGGDMVFVQASVSNANKERAALQYEWKVDISRTPSFGEASGLDITDDLRDLGLIGNTTGNALENISLKLDIPNRAGVTLGGRSLSSYLSNGSGYLRFRVTVSENFDGGGIRKGRSDVIVKFSSTGKKIGAYRVDPVSSNGKTKVRLVTNAPICNASALERSACRVVKNEIIGLRIDPSGLSDFRWMINDSPLTCTREKTSPDCTDGSENHVNFFPVLGNVGESFVISVAANDVTTGRQVKLSRAFHIVEPQMNIVSGNVEQVWPKLLGHYKDVLGRATTACPDGLCPDYAERVLQAFSGGTAVLKAEYAPEFLGGRAVKEWRVDGQTVAPSPDGSISFPLEKFAPGVYNVSFDGVVEQSAELRRALYDVWGVTPLESPEIHFSGVSQIELQEAILAKNDAAPKKYLALLSNYVPETLLFTLRMLLSGFLLLFIVGFFSSLIPEPRRLEK